MDINRADHITSAYTETPDFVKIPSGKIIVLTIRPGAVTACRTLIQPLQLAPRRELFTPHFHYCMPLMAANTLADCGNTQRAQLSC